MVRTSWLRSLLRPRLVVIGLALASMMSCVNPFAPSLDRSGGDNVLGDQRTIEGLFQNFRYAYLFRDTLTYGRLLARNFTFVYRNYDQGIDVTWGRDEDMLATHGLFTAAQQLDLVWNDVIIADGDSLSQNISRGFNLTITFNPADILRAQGRVNLLVERPSATEPWKIVRWRDESNYF
jgi:hypothetical protein